MSESIQALTLTDFLLARIAEDEAWAAANFHFGNGTAPEWVPPVWTRVTAECEAKRRIVERWAWVVERPDWVAMDALSDDARVGRWHLAVLASVYADHPDYQQEWRP